MKHLLLPPAAGQQHRTVKRSSTSRLFSSAPFYACCLLLTFLLATGFTWYKKWWASTYSNVSTSSFPTISFTGRLVTGDFDKDGDDDILYQAGTDGSAIMFAASNGNGTFAAAVPQSASPFRNVAAFNLITTSTHVKDIDGDGDDDMYIAIGNSTGIYLRNDNGTFSSQSTATFPQPQFPGRVVSGDFNKDGDIDFLYQTGGPGSPFNYASNNGNGTFSIGPASNAMFATVILTDMTTELTIVADFDKDGDQDIWVPIGGTTGRYYRNDGTQYSEPPSAGFPAPQYPGRVKVADYDFDGDPDILYQTGVDGSAFGYYQNNGDATFTNISIASSPLNGLSLPNLLGTNYNIVDFDADGDIDIYTTVNNTQGSYFLQQSQGGNPGNQAPVAVRDQVTVTEDVPATGNVLTNDSDPEGNALTASLVTAPVNGTVVLNADGSFTYTPNANYNGQDSLSYQVCDNGTPSLCDTAILLFTVNSVNDAPIAVRDQSTTNENQLSTGNVLTNDSDPEGNGLTASLVTAPVNGTIVLNADGSFTYTPNNNYSGKDSLTYQVCDNGTPSLCDTANLVFTVNAVNNAPIAVRDQANVTEDVPANGNVLTNDSDPEGNALTASLVTAPINGTVVLNADGSFTYTPNANYNGLDSLIYQVCDNGVPSLCDTATVVFTVNSVNDAPIAVRDQVNVSEDVPATGNVLTNDTDPEGNALTASLVTAPVNGTIVLNADGSFTYTPNANYSGKDSLTYQVCDNGTPSLCDTANLVFTVNAVNDTPVAVRDQSTTNENQSSTGNVLTNDSDPEGNSLTASLVTAPVNGTVVLNADGSFTYTPNANYNGLDSLLYQVCDNGIPSLCDTATLVFTVNAVNDAPIAVRDQVNVTEDVPATGNVLTNDTDPEGNALTASLVTAPVNGTVVLNADGSFTYTPNANYNGLDSLIYQVCDNGTPSLCDTAALVFTVNAVNDAPAAVGDQVNVSEDVPATGNVLTNDSDPEGNALTASLVTAPVNGTVVLNADGSFTYTPNSNYSGKDSLTYQVCDNGTPSLCDTANLVFTVTSVNDAPIAVRDQVNVSEDVPATGNVLTNDTDPEGNALTASLVTAPVNGTVVLNADGSFTYTPNNNYSGKDSLTYQVCDNGVPSLCDTANLVFTVTSVNDAPIAVRDQVNVSEDVPATGNVLTNDTDPEGNALTASLVTAPVNGTVVLNADGSFTYTPNSNYSGKDSLTYQVCDNGTPSLCDTANLAFTVNAVNDAPIAVRDQVNVTEDVPATGNVLTNDTDPEGNALTASLVTAPVNGTVVLNADGSFTYTPNNNYSGKDSLTYQVCDNGVPSLCDTANLVFTVTSVNDAPIAVRDQVNVAEDVPATGNVLTNDTDPEGNTLTASLVTAPVNGTVVLNADGSFTYTPNSNYYGKDSLVYQVCDNGTPSLCDTATLVFTIVSVNDAPVAVNDNATLNANNTYNGNALTNDSDPDGDALTASVVAAPKNGTVVLNPNGSFTYTPALNYSGKDSVIYKICDNGTPSLCDTAQINFTVIDNIPPAVNIASSAEDTLNTPFSIALTFSENVNNFTQADITVTNATLSDFTAIDGKTYTAIIRPQATGTATIQIKAGVATDAAGNPNLASGILTRYFDITKPKVTITAPSTTRDVYTAMISFSENVIDFDTSDILVTNGHIISMQQQAPRVYQVQVEPMIVGPVTLQVKAATAQDPYGNPNEASNTAKTEGIQSGFVDKIWPVPTSRFLYVQFKKIMTEKVAIRIVSSSGVIWYNRELSVVNHQITADLGNLPKGVYYLSLRSNWFRYKHTIMVVD